VSGYAGRFNGRVSVENSVDANPVTGVAPLKVGAGGVFLSIDGNEVLSTGDNLYLNQDSGNDVVIGSSGTSADLIGYGNANFDNHLGVGTSSTTYPLQVYSTSDNIVKIQGNDHSIVNIDGTDGSEKSVNFSEDGVLQWKVGMDNDNLTDDDKDSGPGNLDLFVIKHVNNRTPEFSMDADGNVEIAGNLNINGNLTLGGLGGEVRMEDSPTTSVASLSTAIASVSCYGNDIMINCGFSSNSLMYPYAIRQDVYAGNPRCLVSMKNTATGTKTFLARATCLALN
ncbi:hypothetical protein KJ632_05305, partial [Patescibacteria group bacterium]|nr:hypothetical protein [Patescibacteria group bacterium]